MSDLSDALERVRELLRHVAADPQAELVLREHAVTAWDLLAGKGGALEVLESAPCSHLVGPSGDSKAIHNCGESACRRCALLVAATKALNAELGPSP